MREINFKILFLIVCLTSLTLGCSKKPVPKQKGYFRISLPDKSYLKYSGDCPFTFEYPSYCVIKKDETKNSQPCNFTICADTLNANIYLTYKEVNGNINEYYEDARKLVYKHSVKADDIESTKIEYPDKNIYGLIYDLSGDVASSVQFYVTDRNNHFIRGALYFYNKPNKDSLSPVINFMRKDVVKFIETLNWK